MGVSRDTRQTLTVDNFQAPGSAASLRQASRYPQVSPCLQTLRQAGFVPSWHNQYARMAQFLELAGTSGVGTTVPL